MPIQKLWVVAAPALAVGLGAALGAILRWLLGLALNGLFPSIPPGTLAANLLGAYLIGLAATLFGALPDISPLIRLFVITGFLGGLTTFSTFTLEMANLLQANRYYMALTACCLHVGGSLAMFFLGMGTYALGKNIFCRCQ